jgi:hypothetical protein
MTVTRLGVHAGLDPSSANACACLHKKQDTTQKVGRVFSIVADALRSAAVGCAATACLGYALPLNTPLFFAAAAIAFIASATLNTAGHLLRLQQV